MLRVGVLGGGPITQAAHFESCTKARNATLHAICDVADDLRERMAATHAPARSYASYDAMPADPDLEAVIIATSDAFHVPAAILALEAGKHILCEKPLATGIEETESLRSVVARTGKILRVGHMKRPRPSFRMAWGKWSRSANGVIGYLRVPCAWIGTRDSRSTGTTARLSARPSTPGTISPARSIFSTKATARRGACSVPTVILSPSVGRLRRGDPRRRADARSRLGGRHRSVRAMVAMGRSVVSGRPVLLTEVVGSKRPGHRVRSGTCCGIRHRSVQHGLFGPPRMPNEIDDKVAQSVKAAKCHGVCIAALSATYNMIHPDPAVRATGLRRLEVLAAAAAAIETGMITLCTGTCDPLDQVARPSGNRVCRGLA